MPAGQFEKYRFVKVCSQWPHASENLMADGEAIDGPGDGLRFSLVIPIYNEEETVDAPAALPVFEHGLSVT